ncbi:ribosome-associated translation inhibitor RaiA [Desulfovibrio sp. OttesenSCG-928-F20]|nr:ribosome-associated translation inhibitor RaiA [Desulfovibrio sp. OttesenSCG-928-M16]MDL2290589.1 ribosome-associated translation inhibitor RaiA [Desulfovibrio sp. OttesenSCG-928-F20]
MNIAVTYKNFEPSDHLRAYATRRFEKLGRFIHKAENIEMTVVLTVDKFRHKADVQLSGDGISLSAVEQSPDMYATVDLVLDKLQVQLKKHMERMKEKRRQSKALAAPEGGMPAGDAQKSAAPVNENEPVIVEEHVEPKPMFADEAALQLAQRDDVVLIFLNADTERLNVMYHRKQGGYGLIDPGM